MELFSRGDEQLDRPKSQACMEHYHACATYFLCHKHNGMPLGPMQQSSSASAKKPMSKHKLKRYDGLTPGSRVVM